MTHVITSCLLFLWPLLDRFGLSEVEPRLCYAKPGNYIFFILHKIAFSKYVVSQFVQVLLEITKQNSIIRPKFLNSPFSCFNIEKLSVAVANVLNIKFA